jgi:molecular chaperone IbpA
MRAYDLSPLYRSTVGFDRLFSLLDQVTGGADATTGYPPYNIERTGENDYRISIAVAGFEQNELTIEVKENALTVRGEHAARTDAANDYLFRGIAARNFERRFQIADHVTVTGASLVNGLLHVDLVREVPEAAKPRQIPIGDGKATAPKVIDGGKAKAEPKKIAA